MSNSKLLKVMDYLINEQDDKARALLHQIFIEKARAIHEEFMHEDDMEDETLGGDEGESMGREIEHHKKEIGSEQHYGDGSLGEMEDTDLDSAVDDLSDDDMEDDSIDDSMDVEDDDVSMDDDDEDLGDDDMDDEDLGDDDMDDDDDMDMGDHDEGEEGERIHDLEQAIEELKAEFEALKGEVEGGADMGGEDAGMDDAEGEEEGEVEESWVTGDDDDLEEDDFSDFNESNALHDVDPEEDGYEVGVNGPGYDGDSENPFDKKKNPIQWKLWQKGFKRGCKEAEDMELEESIDLEEVPVNMKKPGEVGAGKYSRTEANVRSPIATTRPDMGVRPVQIKSKGHTGYGLEGAPKSDELKGTANRRKKSTDGTSKVSKEGDTRAMLNKDRTDGYGATNVKSPIGSQGTTPKK